MVFVLGSEKMVTSTLNPKAPIFVPLAYRAVEDFSDEWWDLVHSSPWFRDYWLQECFHDPQFDPTFSDIYDPALPDFDLLFDDDIADVTDNNNNSSNAPNQERGGLELISMGLLKWRKPRGADWDTAKYYGDKAPPKIVNVRVSPRPIKQPR
ncbi:hypothetical protein ACH5RR_016859 [Cinchona calisaya]|uniref:Ataxin-2 C-terminal domain-containing protein n=1 Tax=Cinchona calisaya TaxID=153742 RepID=A0ABD3A0K5_9GENT